VAFLTLTEERETLAPFGEPGGPSGGSM